MDPVTHVLSAALATEPRVASLRSRANPWRLRLAAALGALLPDIDGVIGFPNNLDLYRRYHRVITHSVGGLVVVVLVAAALARFLPIGPWLPSLRVADEPPRPSYARLAAFASVGAVLHFLGDWITAWGIWPLWPLSRHDFGLSRVNSLEPVLAALTLVAWAVQHALLVRGRAGAARGVAVVWLALATLWVIVRPAVLGPPFI